jgi:hypothetical protein
MCRNRSPNRSRWPNLRALASRIDSVRITVSELYFSTPNPWLSDALALRVTDWRLRYSPAKG